jgi:hypothetical protein
MFRYRARQALAASSAPRSLPMAPLGRFTTTDANLTTDRSGHASAIIGSYLYVIGRWSSRVVDSDSNLSGFGFAARITATRSHTPWPLQATCFT